MINDNKFLNVTDAVALSFFPENVMRPGFPYVVGPPQYFYVNAYIHTVSVIGNTMSPEDNISFTGSSAGYVKNAVSLSSPNFNLTVPYCNCTGIHIEDNQIYRVLNGISLNAVNPYTISCKNVGVKKIIRGNSITLEEDYIFGNTQHGISFVNSLSEPVQLGQRLQTVENNTITVFGGSQAQSNQNISLYYGNNNGGVGQLFPTPHILCNDLKNANKGFVFAGWNRPASWRGNKMEDLKMGMVLTGTPGGVIGQQGDASNPIDNEWNGNWGITNSGTWVDLGSDGNLSPIYISASVTPWFPQNNFGSAGPSELYSTLNGNLTISTSGSYSCDATGNHTLMNSPVPVGGSSSPEADYIEKTFAYRYLLLNDSMKNSDTDLGEFFDELEGNSIQKFMQIEINLAQGNFTEAQNIFNSLNTATFNAIELHYHRFYELSLKYQMGEGDFTVDDLYALENLASHCPGTNGMAVHQSRALFQLVTGRVFNAQDDCDQSGARGANSERSPVDNKSAWDVTIFPNPNNGNFAVISQNEKEILEISIRDLSGRELYKNKIQTSKHYYVMDLILKNGLYLITIVNEANEMVTKKMGIAK